MTEDPLHILLNVITPHGCLFFMQNDTKKGYWLVELGYLCMAYKMI